MKIKPRHKWTDEQRKELTLKALKGDKTIVDDLIDAHIESTYEISKFYVYKNQSRQDDILCVAFQALVQGCHWACEGRLEDENIQKYLKATIQWAIRDYIRTDFLIVLPKDEYRKRMKQEDFHSYMQRTKLIHNPTNTQTICKDGMIDYIPFCFSYERVRDDWGLDVPVEDIALSAVDDLFIRLNLTEREKDVASLRMEEYTLEEIGKKMNLTAVMIHYIIEDIKNKMDRVGIKASTKKLSGTKICTRCEESKSLSDFYKRSEKNAQTHKSICKGCMKAQRKAKVVA